MKKLIAMALAVGMVFSVTACGSSKPAADSSVASSDSSAANTVSTDTTTTKAGGTLYYLNFKPEVVEVYKEIAKVYKEETGVDLKVETAASGKYEETFRSEAQKSDPPALFQINGPKGYAMFKDYCADLKDTELYKHLSDKNLSVTVNGGVYGLPYVVEGFGIIYNGDIMNKYFALAERATDVKNMDEINSFDKLKAVVEDMQKNKEKLGIKGVFANTSLKPGEGWRWSNHLPNLPLFYEFRDNKVDLSGDTSTVDFKYSDNFKNIFDLYINNSTVPSKILGTKQVTDSIAEFAMGQAAMIQNGNWAWGQISTTKGNVVKAEAIHFLPIYTGVQGEEKQGMCIGTENYFAINKKAAPEKQKLAADFINWLYTSDKGKDFVTNKLKFIAPFDTFKDNEKPTDPLAKEVCSWMSKSDFTNVSWAFVVEPDQKWKDNLQANLLQYAQGKKQWTDVKTAFVNDWKTESATLNK